MKAEVLIAECDQCMTAAVLRVGWRFDGSSEWLYQKDCGCRNAVLRIRLRNKRKKIPTTAPLMVMW